MDGPLRSSFGSQSFFLQNFSFKYQALSFNKSKYNFIIGFRNISWNNLTLIQTSIKKGLPWIYFCKNWSHYYTIFNFFQCPTLGTSCDIIIFLLAILCRHCCHFRIIASNRRIECYWHERDAGLVSASVAHLIS